VAAMFVAQAEPTRDGVPLVALKLVVDSSEEFAILRSNDGNICIYVYVYIDHLIVCIYVYMYMHICIYVNMFICISACC